MACNCPDGCNGCEQEKDWYAHRDELEQGQKFECLDGRIVQLDCQVPGDATRWRVLSWSDFSEDPNGWFDDGDTVEPGDLKRRLQDGFGT